MAVLPLFLRAKALEKDVFPSITVLREAIEHFIAGDVESGKMILRDFINATVGFTKLGTVTNRPPRSLMRMLGPGRNPQARNLFEIVAYLQDAEGVRFHLRPGPR